MSAICAPCSPRRSSRPPSGPERAQPGGGPINRQRSRHCCPRSAKLACNHDASGLRPGGAGCHDRPICRSPPPAGVRHRRGLRRSRRRVEAGAGGPGRSPGAVRHPVPRNRSGSADRRCRAGALGPAFLHRRRLRFPGCSGLAGCRLRHGGARQSRAPGLDRRHAGGPGSARQERSAAAVGRGGSAVPGDQLDRARHLGRGGCVGRAALVG